MKNLLLAILIGVLMIGCFSHIAHDWFGIHLVMGDDVMEPLIALSVVGLVATVLVVVGFFVALSVFGAIALGVVAAIFGLLVAGVTAFWPFILVGAIVYFLVRNKQSPSY